MENVRRNMHFDSSPIVKFQFAIEDLLPIESVEEKSAELRAEKMGLRLEKSKSKSILHSNEISMFLPTHCKLFQRFVILTSNALVVYKDQTSYQTNLRNPWMVIPLCEIQQKEVS